jgi:hypothetical protein
MKASRTAGLVWKTKDGQKIALGDMTDSHLENTIAMLERRKQAYGDGTDFPCYPNFNGEMAQFFAEKDYDRALEDWGLERLANEQWLRDMKKERRSRR